MEVKLGAKDTLQLARAIKGGRLDLTKVDALRELVANYRPFEELNEDELKSAICYLADIGISPTSKLDWVNYVLNEDEIDIHKINIYALYSELIRSARDGIIALKALGFKIRNIGIY